MGERPPDWGCHSPSPFDFCFCPISSNQNLPSEVGVEEVIVCGCGCQIFGFISIYQDTYKHSIWPVGNYLQNTAPTNGSWLLLSVMEPPISIYQHSPKSTLEDRHKPFQCEIPPHLNESLFQKGLHISAILTNWDNFQFEIEKHRVFQISTVYLCVFHNNIPWWLRNSKSF